jgi:hypothetical protein
MNNNAHFFFSLFGFVGFVFFFIVSCLTGEDLLFTLVKSTFGCLFFAIVGRFLLCFALNGFRNQSLNVSTVSAEILQNRQSSKLPLDPSVSATEAMAQAATKARRLVEAKA